MRPHVELLLLAGLGPMLALAVDDIESNDFPVSCRPACQPAVDLSDRCDRTTNDDRAERDCVCQATNARAQFEACAACIKAAPLRPDNDRDDDDDDDDDDRDDGDDDNGQEALSKVMRICNWDIQSVSPSSGGGTAATTTPPSPSASGSSSGGGGVLTTSVTDASGRPTVSTVTPVAGATGTGGAAPGDSAGSVAAPRLGLALGGAVAGMLWGLQAWL